MIAMMAATGQEIEGISRCLKKRRLNADGCRAWRGEYKSKEVLTVQMGIGRNMAEGALAWVLASFTPEALISLGFGGALNERLRIGDLIICAKASSGDRSLESCQADAHLTECALRAVKGNGRKWLAGNSVTVSRLHCDAGTRQKLAEKVRADVCEMEDYWLACAAGAKGIPFLSVRVIYDEIDASLPGFERMVDARGNVRPGGIAAHLFTHPRQLLKMWGSYRDCRRAQASLAAFTEKFLDTM